jgi:hypothetical protein
LKNFTVPFFTVIIFSLGKSNINNALLQFLM